MVPILWLDQRIPIPIPRPDSRWVNTWTLNGSKLKNGKSPSAPAFSVAVAAAPSPCPSISAVTSKGCVLKLQNVVASISCDKAVWDAILNNRAVQDLRDSISAELCLNVYNSWLSTLLTAQCAAT
ncbi:unnamed protein product [Coffea canephora]|uniref:Uncharacterized protein n=1 Tax=Coffea canephora TaxID=49390 RepID=A0A068V8X2_COFCA|nr:unnamed protein product [Coffea canephora]